jgi:Zn finger protein HypA/HybF involved in hydrogenase expression
LTGDVSRAYYSHSAAANVVERERLCEKEKRRVNQMAQAYCVKCRKKREIQNPKKVVLKNKRPAISGTCPVCKTKVFRIGKG